MAVPKLRFKEFDGDWSIKPLKNICKINQGLQIAIENRFTDDGVNRYFYITNEFLREGAKKTYFIENPPRNVICDENDILMTRTGNTGQVVTDVKGAFHNNFFKIDFDRSIINKNFFIEFLKKDTTQHLILKYAGASTIPDLNHSDFYRIVMPITTIKEQTKIASFLSNVDEKISQLTQKHDLLSQYKQGMMQKLFSQQIRFKADDGSEFGEWEFIKLNQLGKSYNGLTSKTKDDFGNGDAYVTYKQIFDNRKINLQKIDKVNIQPHETQNRVIKGDLFFTTSSEIPEEVAYCSAILDDFDYPLYLNSFCFGFRPNNQNQLNSNYASFFFRSNQFRNTILHLAQGSTRFNISKTAFMDMKIALPRVEEQTKIANFLSAIDQKIEVVAQQIEQAKTWKKGLLQQMFV